MSFVLFAFDFWQFAFGTLMGATALFLILLVLVQRGRGGGLSGALGGMGGQSAFGTKAGDVFTKVTVGTAVVWILLAMAAVKFINPIKSFGDGSVPTGMSSAGANDSTTDTTDTTPDATDTTPDATDTTPDATDTTPDATDATSDAPESKSDATNDASPTEETPE